LWSSFCLVLVLLLLDNFEIDDDSHHDQYNDEQDQATPLHLPGPSRAGNTLGKLRIGSLSITLDVFCPVFNLLHLVALLDGPFVQVLEELGNLNESSFNALNVIVSSANMG
jgi:hypothetical protein